MTWVKLDDGFYRNRKARMAGKDGRALFLAGLCHCANALTDGHIGKYDLPVIAAEAEVKAGVAATLVKVGMWREVDDGWVVNDYNRWNRPADSVRRERDEGRERAARSRERKRNADGTFGGTNGERTTDQSSSSSSPLGVSSVSDSSSSSGVRVDENDDWATIVAKRRLAQRESEKGKVTSRRKWMETTLNDVHNEHNAAAVAFLAQYPNAAAVDVANHLEPPVGYRIPPHLRAVRDDCPRCHGTGWVDDTDPAVRCDHTAVAS